MESHLLCDLRLFEFADYFVVGEGETAIAHLADSLSNNESVGDAPNLIRVVRGRPHALNTSWVENIRTASPPDFEGLDLAQYLSPEPVLLLSASRGCYWGKCTFCDVSRQTRSVYRPVHRASVLADMVRLNRRYGARRFFFCDDALAPSTMREIAKGVAAELPTVTWQAEARLEKGLTDDFLHYISRGGCRQLIFGYESSSQRMLDIMKKNNSHARDQEIITSCVQHGIAINLQTFVGLPTETEEEAWRTVNFLLENERHICSIGFGVFSLWKDTPIYNNPSTHGATALWIPIDNCLLAECEFETTSGMSRREAMAVHEEANVIIDQAFSTRMLYLGGAAGSHSLLHLSHYSFSELYEHWHNLDKKIDLTSLSSESVRLRRYNHWDECAEGASIVFVPARALCLKVPDGEDRAVIAECVSGLPLEGLIYGDRATAAVDDVVRVTRRACTVETLLRAGVLESFVPGQAEA